MADTRGFEAFLAQIKRHGMDADTYRHVSSAFAGDTSSTPSPVLREVLQHYVGYDESPVYVNEIRNFLRENDPALLEAYGRLFIRNTGCMAVFGIEPRDAVDFCFVEDAGDGAAEAAPKAKVFCDKRKARMKNKIRQQAKAAAIEKHMQRQEKKTEKKAKRADYEALVRRENGS